MSKSKPTPKPVMAPLLSFEPGENWRRIAVPNFEAAFRHATEPMSVLVSWDLHTDGKRWLHVSVSHRSRIPVYDELCDVKARFVGRGRRALHVFPEERFHVNCHPFCLHLWACLDGDGLPEFSGAVAGVGRTI